MPYRILQGKEMKIKAVVFDIDCTISKTDMLEFVAKNIGKEKEGEYWERIYHKSRKLEDQSKFSTHWFIYS